jgi:hypothetical protein
MALCIGDATPHVKFLAAFAPSVARLDDITGDDFVKIHKAVFAVLMDQASDKALKEAIVPLVQTATRFASGSELPELPLLDRRWLSRALAPEIWEPVVEYTIFVAAKRPKYARDVDGLLKTTNGCSVQWAVLASRLAVLVETDQKKLLDRLKNIFDCVRGQSQTAASQQSLWASYARMIEDESQTWAVDFFVSIFGLATLKDPPEVDLFTRVLRRVDKGTKEKLVKEVCAQLRNYYGNSLSVTLPVVRKLAVMMRAWPDGRERIERVADQRNLESYKNGSDWCVAELFPKKG